MSTPVPGPCQSVSRRARAEAAAWLAKLHGNQRTPAMELGWKQWLSERPDHAAAWQLATDSWGETGDLPYQLPSWSIPGRQRRMPGLLSLVAIAATCLVALCLAFLYVDRSSYTTRLGEQRTLNLGDGSRIELNTSSRVTVEFDDQTRMVILRSGEAYFNVAHERRPFVVVAGTRKIIAVGTSFLVRREVAADDAVTVTLIEGRVAVEPATGANELPAESGPGVAILSGGKRLRTARHVSPAIDTPSIDQETAWMRGQLIFENTPLREAVEAFNRYNTVKIRLNSPRIVEIPVGGIFGTTDAASFAIAVAQAHALTVVRDYREIVLQPMEGDPRQNVP